MWPQYVCLQRLLCPYCQLEWWLHGVPLDTEHLLLHLWLDINSSEHILQKQKFPVRYNSLVTPCSFYGWWGDKAVFPKAESDLGWNTWSWWCWRDLSLSSWLQRKSGMKRNINWGPKSSKVSPGNNDWKSCHLSDCYCIVCVTRIFFICLHLLVGHLAWIQV